jgi:hypothetical protein
MPDMLPVVGQAPRHKSLWFHFGHGHQGLTEHTQDTAERLGDMNFWPDDVRSQVMKITGRCAELGMERMRTARHAPTATQPLD